MANHKKIITDKKECVLCKRTLPRNNSYFRVSYGHADGFQSKCKECIGSKFSVQVGVKEETLKCWGDCKKDKTLVEFYPSHNPMHEKGKLPLCKLCLNTMSTTKKQIDIAKLKVVLEKIDRPFIYDVVKIYIDEKIDGIGSYIRHLGQSEFKMLKYKDSIFEAGEIIETTKPIVRDNDLTARDIQNQEDILNTLGFDPFEDDPEEDKKGLYNRLVDYLDDSTLKDSFKLPIVIEIVKSFNQINKINKAISNIPIDDIITNVTNMKNLMGAKTSMTNAILSMAKDNGISVNHSNNKSAGAGTLSGIMKDLIQKEIKEVEINLYDIKTCEGIQQVADISNKSIMNQLMLNESDYTDMIRDQRKIIDEYELKFPKFEEENRLLKIKIKNLIELEPKIAKLEEENRVLQTINKRLSEGA